MNTMIQPQKISCSGYQIAADWYRGTTQKRILLALPGYTSSKSRQQAIVSAIVKHTGMSALAIDYTGHGESPFELAETRPAQHLLEVSYAYDWLSERYPEAEIAVMGTSYGGFLAAGLSRYRDFTQLVLRAPAIYPPSSFYTPWSVRLADEDSYRQIILPYRRDKTALNEHPFLSQEPLFNGKTLVAVHEHDETVPRETTDAYIHAFQAESFIAHDFTHAVSESPITPEQFGEYQQRIAEWLE